MCISTYIDILSVQAVYSLKCVILSDPPCTDPGGQGGHPGEDGGLEDGAGLLDTQVLLFLVQF